MKAQNETVPSLVHSETPIGKGKVKDECKSLFCWYSLNFEKKFSLSIPNASIANLREITSK
jgi:hypothetical protein